MEDEEPELQGDMPMEQRIESKEEFWTDITKEARAGRKRVVCCVCCMQCMQWNCFMCPVNCIPLLSLFALVFSAVKGDYYLIPTVACLTFTCYTCNACHGWTTGIIGLRYSFRCYYYSHWCMICCIFVVVLIAGFVIALCHEPTELAADWPMCSTDWGALALVIDGFCMLCLAPPLLWCSNELRKYLNLKRHRKKEKKATEL